MALLCKELAKILTEGELDISIDELDIKEPKWEELNKFLDPLNIHNVK
jgi:hypothetical protein